MARSAISGKKVRAISQKAQTKTASQQLVFL